MAVAKKMPPQFARTFLVLLTRPLVGSVRDIFLVGVSRVLCRRGVGKVNLVGSTEARAVCYTGGGSRIAREYAGAQTSSSKLHQPVGLVEASTAEATEGSDSGVRGNLIRAPNSPAGVVRCRANGSFRQFPDSVDVRSKGAGSLNSVQAKLHSPRGHAESRSR